jgi:hypothetical protein
MPLSRLVEAKEKTQGALKDMAISKLPEIQSIAMSLYNDPEARRPNIINDYITEGYKLDLLETGNKDLSKAKWDRIAQMVEMKADDLAMIPSRDRGDLWYIAMSIIVSASNEQAAIMSGETTESFRIGDQEAKDLRKYAGDIPLEKLVGAPFKIKEAIRNGEKARRKAAKDGD